MTPDGLAALHAKCFEMPRPWSADEFGQMLQSYGVFLQTCEAGFVLGRAICDEVELLTIAIDPSCQRRGHGRALLTAFEQKSCALGAKVSFLEVAQNNTAARALYQAAGYRESGRRPDYYRTPDGKKIAALTLRKPLI
jgi:ribosomal-protein-alanine N-acetyltransferase